MSDANVGNLGAVERQALKIAQCLYMAHALVGDGRAAKPEQFQLRQPTEPGESTIRYVRIVHVEGRELPESGNIVGCVVRNVCSLQTQGFQGLDFADPQQPSISDWTWPAQHLEVEVP